MSSGPKAAALPVLADSGEHRNRGPFWFWALWVSAVLTMFVGNFAALAQTSIKRLLAYSSIAHAGYILVALAAAAAADQVALGVAAALFYLAIYALMKVGAFMMVAQLGGLSEGHLEIDDLAGLGARQPRGGGLLLSVPAFAPRPARDGRLPRQVLHLQRRPGLASGLARRPARDQYRHRRVLLPAHHRRDVHARA